MRTGRLSDAPDMTTWSLPFISLVPEGQERQVRFGDEKRYSFAKLCAKERRPSRDIFL